MDKCRYREDNGNIDGSAKAQPNESDESLSEGEVPDEDEGVIQKTKPAVEGTCSGHEWRQIVEDSAASCLVDQLNVRGTSEQEKSRGIEAYNFRAKFSDRRPDPHLPELGESEALHKLRQEKTVGVKSRLGKRHREPEANLEVNIELARIERAKILEEGDPEEVAYTRELAESLNESNVILLAHVVALLGIERCRRLLQMTLTLELAGGMLTRDGSRRRTAGGVFLQLVKEDKSLTKAQLRSLFQPHQTLIKRKNKKMRIFHKAHEALDKLEKAFAQ